MMMNELAQRNTGCSVTLLPPNATKLERALEESIKYNVDPSILAGFKFAATGSNINLALSWEYSLAQINVDNFKDRIIQGLKFHRLKGTPYSLKQALSWYGLTGIIIEEESAGSNFANFQIGFDELPDVLDVETIVNTAKLAAPLRSNLARMYNKDYDVRPFVLDKSGWGDMLSDYSGVRLSANSPKLSFRRKMIYYAKFPNQNAQQNFKEELFAATKLDDSFKLGFGVLDKTRLSNRTNQNFYKETLTAKNTNQIAELPDELLEMRPITKAMTILSGSTKLDDYQNCFAGSYEKKNDKPFTLSFSKLSVRNNKSEIVPINVRYTLEISANATYDATDLCASTGLMKEHAIFGARINLTVSETMQEAMTVAGKYRGNSTWSDHVYFDVPWCEQNWYGKMTED